MSFHWTSFVYSLGFTLDLSGCTSRRLGRVQGSPASCPRAKKNLWTEDQPKHESDISFTFGHAPKNTYERSRNIRAWPKGKENVNRFHALADSLFARLMRFLLVELRNLKHEAWKMSHSHGFTFFICRAPHERRFWKIRALQKEERFIMHYDWSLRYASTCQETHKTKRRKRWWMHRACGPIQKRTDSQEFPGPFICSLLSIFIGAWLEFRSDPLCFLGLYFLLFVGPKEASKSIGSKHMPDPFFPSLWFLSFSSWEWVWLTIRSHMKVT